MYYCGKIFGETDFLDLVSSTDWSIALRLKISSLIGSMINKIK